MFSRSIQRLTGRFSAVAFLAWPGVALALPQATTVRVSVSSTGAQGNSSSFDPAISADGTRVAFESYSSQLVLGDTNNYPDIFVRDLTLDTTVRANLGPGGVQANGPTFLPSISTDGHFVAFQSGATNLVPLDTNAREDVFVRDLTTGTTLCVSVDSSGVQGDQDSIFPDISGDGRYVTFSSTATNLVPGDTNAVGDVFVHDAVTGSTTRASVDSSGVEGDQSSLRPRISKDGRYVVFQSLASNLVPGDSNNSSDAFIHDMLTGQTDRVSLDSNGIEGISGSLSASISADDRFVAFESLASNLVAGDTNGFADIFVRDLVAGLTTRVSVSTSGSEGDNVSGYGTFTPWTSTPISADGRFVAFTSYATNLVPLDTNGWWDIFLHDRLTGETTRASVTTGGLEVASPNAFPALSADGRRVAFASLASSLVLGDTNSTWDIFLRDRGPNTPVGFCVGDGSGGTCPCGNFGATGHGCENSAATGGAILTSSGESSLSGDTLVLTSSAERPTSLSLFLQGTQSEAPVFLGDGLRCTGGTLKRMFVKSASGGLAVAPQPGDPSISARSAAVGDSLALGTSRFYQVYYRDAVSNFCPAPAGGNANMSSGLILVWGP